MEQTQCICSPGFYLSRKEDKCVKCGEGLDCEDSKIFVQRGYFLGVSIDANGQSIEASRAMFPRGESQLEEPLRVYACTTDAAKKYREWLAAPVETQESEYSRCPGFLAYDLSLKTIEFDDKISISSEEIHAQNAEDTGTHKHQYSPQPQCSEGRMGIACGVCEPGWNEGADLRCRLCKSGEEAYVVIILFIAFFFVIPGFFKYVNGAPQRRPDGVLESFFLLGHLLNLVQLSSVIGGMGVTWSEAAMEYDRIFWDYTDLSFSRV